MLATTARSDDTRGDDGASELPRQIGRYDLLDVIASGGMATVYLGRARGAAGFGRFVAIKCCHPHLRAQEEFATMFVDEARLAARIHHPNVIATLDVGEDSAAALYLVMEFVDGYPLWQLIRAARARGERVPPGVAVRIMVDALSGLHAAHELRGDDGASLGLVHRDVSPQNVLVGVEGVSRIMDFGIAKAESRLTSTRDGRVKGKLCYMAPEQHGLDWPEDRPRPSMDRRADVYAAGIVLWEALTGQSLFQGETDSETVRRMVRLAPQPPSQVIGGAGALPTALDAAVLRALERDPARRFATAEQFADALEGCGLALPSARGVAAYVRDLLARSIERRHATLARFRAAASPDDAAAARSEPRRAVSDAEGVVVAHAEAGSGTATTARRSRRGWGIAAAAAALVAGALGGASLAPRWRHGVAVSSVGAAHEVPAARPPTAPPPTTAIDAPIAVASPAAAPEARADRVAQPPPTLDDGAAGASSSSSETRRASRRRHSRSRHERRPAGVGAMRITEQF